MRGKIFFIVVFLIVSCHYSTLPTQIEDTKYPPTEDNIDTVIPEISETYITTTDIIPSLTITKTLASGGILSPTTIPIYTDEQYRNIGELIFALVDTSDIPDDLDWVLGSNYEVMRNIAKPEDIENCIVNCVTGTWSDMLSITLYQSLSSGQSNYILNKLKKELSNNYPYASFLDPQELEQILRDTLNGYSGWAAIITRKENRIDHYFATSIGPIAIIINISIICNDACNIEYPITNINLARLQVEKIIRLIDK
jgi:hypothetical protein